MLGMPPKRKKKKKSNGRLVMDQLVELIVDSALDIGATNIPNPSKLAMLDSGIPNLPKLTMFENSRVLSTQMNDPQEMEVPTTNALGDKKKRRKHGMSVKASSFSPLNVMDINITKRDRYEHPVPVIKSMERSVNQEWADLEL